MNGNWTASVTIGSRYRTGETSPTNGKFQWDEYTDGSRTPAPTAEEKVIPLDKGETFPPIRSCNKGCYWVLIEYA